MPPREQRLSAFDSELVDRIRAAGNVWRIDGGEILLPRAFGFCRGVKRALASLEETCDRHGRTGKRIFLLGQIIHNPWVNDYFRRRGVQLLSNEQRQRVEEHIRADDCAVIPAFGVPLGIEQHLRATGCEVVDTSCGDVRRLWLWAERAVRDGYAVLVFGKADHDETVVTKSRLAAAGGSYVVANSLDQVRRLCELIVSRADGERFRAAFGPEATNADSLDAFHRLAQVSQTTMLYSDTMKVRQVVHEAFVRAFGQGGADERLQFQPTVCHATQDRQAAAVELCAAGPDLVLVVGGFQSSNTRNLYGLASEYARAYFIEDAEAFRSAGRLHTIDHETDKPVEVADWLPARRPLRVGILAGASSPEIVVGQVLQKLADLLRS